MRRLLIIFLMLLLPTQWTWAAVASACQHETGVAAQHVGHHEHVHEQAGPDADQDLTAAAGDQQPTFDADCHTCHGSCASILMPMGVMPSSLEAGYVPSHHSASFADRSVDHPLRPPRAVLA
ncbi:hypothetical protein [Rivibacter subsaxonicus]|uniref:Cobalt-zinc-cadmium efflux system protein n=1 Tax=Rivibacter subsaxonicus TaxID=457575 RepID=A0A4V2FU76_9BURK|nr:hypothetical protein [Rivibacter subsaxonicus]RZU00906.1 hypothetical protein EV670_1619 [Rivibacter subsaxonicus]